MADVVVLNDPITGQGSNNAAKCAAAYLDGIVGHGDRSYDDAFKRGLFEYYWAYAKYVVAWTNTMLDPPTSHALQMLGAAQEKRRLPSASPTVSTTRRILPIGSWVRKLRLPTSSLRIGALAPSPTPRPAEGFEESSAIDGAGKRCLGCATGSSARRCSAI